MLDFDDPVRSFNRCKSIDELYEEVKDCDLVITNDVALATALNARIDRPLIGKFAMTPREIAAKNAIMTLGRKPISDIELVRSVSEETGLDPTFVHGEIENFRSIRCYLKDVRKYLYGDQREVYDSYIKHPTLDKVMEDFDVVKCDDYLKCSKIAVIDGPLFNQLDRNMNPFGTGICEVIEVNSATKEEHHIDSIHIVGSDRQIANNVIELIDPERATDYAIVINSESPIVNSIRTSLYRKGIAFVNELELRDMDALRRIVSFVDLSLNYDTIRVSDIRGMFASLGSRVLSKFNNRLLNKMDDKELDRPGIELRAFMKNIRDKTFLDIAKRCLKRDELEIAIPVLDEIGILNENITTGSVNYLEYMVNNIKDLKFEDKRPMSEKKGVLLADCNRSCHIDRPIVFYIGLGQDWDPSMPGKRYMEFDREEEESKNAYRIQILLQQGQERKYFVNMNKDGKEAVPSSVFNLLFERPPEHFSDICDRIISGRWQGDYYCAEPTKDDSLKHRADGFRINFSKSSYSNYLECPYKFELSRLLGSEDKDVTEMGNLIHSFAELYACHPDLVNDMGIERLEKDIYERYSGLSYPALTEIDKDRIHINILNAKALLDELKVKLPLDTPIDPDRESNELFQRYGVKEKSSCFEKWVEGDNHPIEGKMDLVWKGTIYDLKTGKHKTPKEYLRDVKKYNDYQPYIYLELAKNIPDRNGRFVLYYTSANERDALSGNIDVRNNMIEISLEDEDARTLFIENHIEMAKKDGFTRLADPDVLDRFYTNVLQKMEGGRKQDIRFAKDLVKWLKPTQEEESYLKHTVFDNVKNYIIHGQIVSGNRIIVPRSKLDEILKELDENHAKMMNESRTEFLPPEGAKCKDCDYRIYCTKMRLNSEGGEDDDE